MIGQHDGNPVYMYDPGSMQNLTVRDAPQVLPGERISVTQITVTERR